MAPLRTSIAAALLAAAPTAVLGQTNGAPAVPLGATVLQTDLYCTQYGTLPQEVVPGISDIAQSPVCIPGFPSQVLRFTDNTGNNRTACFYPNPHANASQPLPLLTWVHPSLYSASGSLAGTGLLEYMNTTLLNNENGYAIGYHLLTPDGLYGTHQYPAEDRVGLGWDNWYRNFNRSDPTFNADVQTIDYFISMVNSTGLADPRRLFVSGWSNGASMATQYAMVTPGIASAAVYSAPDPWRDVGDRCTQIPLPTYATPTMDVHNACDIAGICTTGKYFRDDLAYRYPSKPTDLTIISPSVTNPQVLAINGAATCNPSCAPFAQVVNATATNIGTAAHTRWPYTLNSVFFNYLFDHPLPTSMAWPQLNSVALAAYPYPNVITGIGFNKTQFCSSS